MKQAMTISFRWFFVLALPCIVFGTPIGVSAATGINDQISFQGKVVNTNGTNVANGNYDFVFRIYTVSSGGVAAWTETWNSGTAQVTVTDGIFQVNLGTHTDLPGSIDFNTDNIYLGIEFNGDGEMSPRVHFTAAPYAFNAMRVGGLTVTDTTGTLTVPNGETISFGGSFTTSASNDVTLTTSGATNVTLPTTGTLATLAGNEVFTNKTIGSTGLTFSGATTDLTTASGEDLTLTAAGAGVIVLSDSVTSGALTISGATTDITTASGESLVLLANGAGTIDLQDATTADSLTLDSGGLTFQNSETIGNGTDDIIAFGGAGGADNTDLFLDLDGTSPLLYSNTDVRVSVDDFLNVQVSGVTGAAAGDIWYDSAANKFKINENGTTKILCNTTDLGCAAGSTATLQDTYGNDADGSNATISLTSADDSLIFTNPSSSGTDSAFLLQLSQANTTAGVVALDITQSSNNANGVNLTTNFIDTETGLAITANALTNGTALSLDSLSAGIDGASLLRATLTGAPTTSWTGNLALFEATAADADVDGNILKVGLTGAAAGSGTAINVTTAQSGTGALALRVNDDGTYTDSTAFVIDASGNIAIGDATPNYGVEINKPNLYFYDSVGSLDYIYATQGNVNIGTSATPDARLDVNFISSSVSASASYGLQSTVSDTGVVTTGTDTTYGTDIAVSRTGATGGTITTYGLNILATTDNAGSGTSTAYGTLINTGTSGATNADTVYGLRIETEANSSTTATGLYVDAGSAAGTEYAAAFMNGNVGIGTATPLVDLHIDNTAISTTSFRMVNGNSNKYGYLTFSDPGESFLEIGSANNGPTGTIILSSDGSVAIADGGTNRFILDASGNLNIGTDTAPDALFTVGNTSQFQVNSSGAIAATTGITSTGAIAANGGITFDAATDTVGAFTANGTIDMNANILTNIGNSGTDFVASTGALTLAGVLTANGGITLASSQSFTASSLSYMDLGSITHGTTAVQGLRLPQAASASPSSPLSGEGYLAWDAAGNQLIYYTGSAWSPVSGSASDLQTTYAADADGGNATISLTTADDSLVITNPTSSGTDSAFVLQLSQQNTTAAVTVLDISQSSNAANAVNLTANSIDTETGLAITANALTTGTALSLASSSTAITSASLLTATFSGAPAASWTGSLALFEATSADVDVDGSALKVGLTGAAAGDGIALNITTAQTGTSALALRVSDDGTYTDSTPFVVTAAGAVGIGTAAPVSMFELYGAGTADIVSTLTSPDATYDPLIKFRTESTPAVQFTLGVDNSDGDKFKIYSGDGIGTGEEFVIDSNGVTTISNLNLGAISFDENAGAVTWVDMSVTAAAPVDTIESYTAAIDGNDMFTIYAESDGAGSIQDKRVVIGTSGAGSTAPALLALDVKSSTGDPTGFEGAMYYNTNDNVFRCYQNSGWTNCIGSGGGYATIKDESTSLTQRTTLAFLGAGVSCADNVTQTECTISGGAGSDLQGTYDTGAAGDQVISLDATQDSIIVRNPSSAGTDSAFVFKTEQLNTGIANDAVYIDNRGTGNGLRIDDASSDTTPFIIDANGNVGIGTSSIATPTGKSTPALQVGSATNRANSSFYGDITAEGYDIKRNLTGIIDIFVYDTSRDADGGEWRSNTLSQQLSWFTETKDNTGTACVIGTDDRCGKSEFPRKAILVTTATALYIFDGGDNTLWMTFTQAGTYAMGADTNNNPSGVGAQNGVIVVGTNGSSATGMYAFDFKQDTLFRYNATNRVQGDKNIGNRNSTVTYSTDANTSFAIADAVVNDVSIAMQTASSEGMANTLTLPTDSASSPIRGVTLIAAATNTAISVVNMASRKTLNYSDVTNDDYYQVVMTTRGRLYATNATQQQLEEWKNIDRDVANETNGTPDRTYDELTPNGAAGKTPITTGTAPTFSASNPGQLAVIERSSSARESAATTLLESGDIVFVGSNQGLAEVHTSGGNLAGASWSKITTTTTATPYMVGAPRGVFTFDEAAGSTAATSAVGTAASTKQVLDQAGATAPTFGGGGVRGTSVNFNNNSYLCSDANSDGTCDADTDFNAGTIGFTVSLWFKHSTTAASDTLFERCYTPATPTVAVGCIWAGMTSTGAIKIGLDSITTWTYETTYDDSVTSTATYADNQWHHMVYTNTDTDICLYIDGKQAAACDTSLAATATLDASQVLTVGGVCSGANCGTGTNFWDGSIDDFVWSSNGATTDNGLPAQGALKLYLDGRAHLIRPATTVTDATAFSSTTIGDSGESYVPGSFAGLIVELTGGTGAGQTRMIVSNDATTLTVSPAWSTTPDATTDYTVNPARLYGATNAVTAIAPDLPTNLNRLRKVYVGTSDGSDGGGVTVYTNAGTGSLKTGVIHSDAGYPSDDLGSAWSGTDADDISAMQAYSDTVAIGNGAFMRASRSDIGLKQLQLDVGSAIEDIRQELVAKQLYGSTQDVLGLGQGADLAERYYSNESLEAGEIVSIDKAQEAGVKRSVSAYQRDILGVVATKPAITLGPVQENAYPVALAGRVPVKVTNENGPIYAGDRITASSRPGYGMFASQAGRVIGTALADAGDWIVCPDEDTMGEHPRMCTTVLVFVNLSDYYGQPVELAMAERAKSAGLDAAGSEEEAETGLNGEGNIVRLAAAEPTREEKIMSFLKEVRDEKAKYADQSSEVFTDRVAASTEIITPKLIVDEIFAKSIKADSIEGLAIYTNRIESLEAKYAGLSPEGQGTGDIEMPAQSSLLNLEQFSVGSLAVALDASLLGKLSVAGALTVADAAQFEGETTFARLATFVSETLFRGPVTFEKVPTFSSDTAGFATIPEGTQRVRVAFDEAYAKQPIVAVTLTRDVSPILEGADESLRADIETVEAEYATEIFAEDVRFIVTEKDQTGFTILLAKEAPADLAFSWVAIAVREPKTSTAVSVPDTGGESGVDAPTLPEGSIESTKVPADQSVPVIENPPVSDEIPGPSAQVNEAI